MPINLTRDIYLINNSMGSNIYLITGNGLTLVDAGFPVDLPAIHLGLRRMGATPRDLDLIVATHYHGDHVGTVAGLRKRYGVRTAIHEGDAPFACGEVPYERFEVETSRLVFYTALWPFFRYRPFAVDRPLREGDILDLAGGLEVIHTPGHTVGSICLYQRSRGILFSGDLIRNENGILEGPPQQFTPDPASACRSLEKISEIDFDVLLPGHGEVILGGAGELFRSLVREGRIWPFAEGWPKSGTGRPIPLPRDSGLEEARTCTQQAQGTTGLVAASAPFPGSIFKRKARGAERDHYPEAPGRKKELYPTERE